MNVALGQSDDELLKNIRQHYYSLQNELSSLNKVVLNDSISYYLKDSAVVKINFRKGVLNEELYYFKNYTCPYFVFSRNGNKENRYYFESYAGNNYLRMIKWIDHDKKERSIESSDFKSINNDYFFRGKNLKVICENKISMSQLRYMNKLVDSLKSLNYKMVSVEPFHVSDDSTEVILSDNAMYKLMDKSGKVDLYVELNWYDCAGGGSTRSYHYELPDNRLIEEVKVCRESFGEYSFSYCYNLIHYNDGKNSYKIEYFVPYEDYADKWDGDGLQFE